MTTIAGRIEQRTMARMLDAVWRTRWLGLAVAIGVAALAGLLVALLMPRGPITTAGALSVMALGFAAGFGAGLSLHARWAMLLAPIAYISVFELGRIGVEGPTVDGITFSTPFGILAFVLGRGVHGLLAMLPMLLGVTYGAALARRIARPAQVGWSAGRVVRSGVAGLLTIGLVALAVLIALPAHTPPILGPDGQPLPGSVAELATVRIGGHDQAVMIRGNDIDNPVLLYLSGGPGQSDLAYSRVLFEDLAHDFVVVSWDQRGTGKSYPAIDPTSTLTPDQAVADTIELTNYLRERFGEDKIYLLGESWGTTLSVLAAQRAPDLYHAVISSGQMVSQRETDRRLYQDMLAYAAQTGDEQLAQTMRDYGEPPYADVHAYAFVMGYYDALAGAYTPPQAYIERGTASGVGPWGLLASEYDLIEKVNVLRGLIDMFAVMYPQLQQIDFRQDVLRLDVPIYVLDGAHELAARRALAHEWFEQLQAPQKRLFSFENAGHSTVFEQFEAVHQIMTEIVLPETYPARTAS